MDKLIEAIKITIPKIVEEWNNIKINQFEKLFEQSFKVYFSNKQTQEKTKIVSPIIDVLFSKIMKSILDDFIIDEGSGRDYKWNSIDFESKITLSIGDSWTGNGYKKTDYHILLRFEINDDGKILSYYSAIANLGKCISKWSTPKGSNFSSLKFINEDAENITIIHGGFSRKTKYLDFHTIRV